MPCPSTFVMRMLWVLAFKMRLNLEFILNLHKQRKKLEKTHIQFIISFILSASKMLILNPSRYKREGTEEFETFACVFIQTPSPFGYSLLSKRESCLPCFWRRKSSKHKQNKILPDTNNFQKAFVIYSSSWRGGGFEKQSFLKTEEFSFRRIFFALR